jgi:hypothetical protein
MEIMDIMFNLFYKQDYKAQIKDNCLYSGSSSTIVINNSNITGINSEHCLKYYAKIPFAFNSTTLLTDEQITIIEEAYKNYSNNNKYKEEFEFIKYYKILNDRLYRFYKIIKDLEFIPKTYDHLYSLYACIKDRSF